MAACGRAGKWETWVTAVCPPYIDPDRVRTRCRMNVPSAHKGNDSERVCKEQLWKFFTLRSEWKGYPGGVADVES